ncbi:PaaI family thioesterase [candidate division NPL-UPA2 bacterium]|nr:PaaI family thioesterase [candidate division NPL-UPA2 bacterium]
MELRDEDVCFVCGKKNARGFKLDFSLDEEKKTMETILVPEEWQQGYAEIIHGGIIATLLDEVMTKLVFELGMNAVTAELSVRFKKPVGLNDKLLVKGQINEETSRIIYAKAEAKFEDGSLAAEANSKLIIV